MERIKKAISIICSIAIIFVHLSQKAYCDTNQNEQLFLVNAINVKTWNSQEIQILNHLNEAYIEARTAAYLAEMEYYNQGENIIFVSDNHEVNYEGQAVLFNGKKFYKMQDILGQLLCSYSYLTESKAIGYSPTESFVENLYNDCEDIYSKFDLRWIKDIPFVEVTVLYDIVSSGWKINALWGGNKQEQYEKTLWGIMLPKESKSDLLLDAKEINNPLKNSSTIISFVKESIKDSEIEQILQLESEELLESYKMLNEAIPGLDISSIISLLENGYAAKNASELYAHSVKYGLYLNKKINDKQLSKATKAVYRYYEDNNDTWISVISDIGKSLFKGNMQDLLKTAMEEELGYNNLTVKMAKIIADKVLGMESKVGATLTLLDCAEIQQEAIDQYNDSFSVVEQKVNVIDPLLMKYSTILYLRACQYGYEKFSSTGELGKEQNELMEPLIQKNINILTSYSDEELTKKVCNERLDFSMDGFEKIDITINEEKALAIAEELIGRYTFFINVGVACVGDFSPELTVNEEEEIWNMLTEKQLEYMGPSPVIFKSSCCNNYDEAVKETMKFIDSSLIYYLNADYAVYNDELYFFLGARGFAFWDNVEVESYDEEKITVLADCYPGLLVPISKDRFVIERNNDYYMIKSVNEVETYY